MRIYFLGVFFLGGFFPARIYFWAKFNSDLHRAPPKEKTAPVQPPTRRPQNTHPTPTRPEDVIPAGICIVAGKRQARCYNIEPSICRLLLLKLCRAQYASS